MIGTKNQGQQGLADTQVLLFLWPKNLSFNFHVKCKYTQINFPIVNQRTFMRRLANSTYLLSLINFIKKNHFIFYFCINKTVNLTLNNN